MSLSCFREQRCKNAGWSCVGVFQLLHLLEEQNIHGEDVQGKESALP